MENLDVIIIVGSVGLLLLAVSIYSKFFYSPEVIAPVKVPKKEEPSLNVHLELTRYFQYYRNLNDKTQRQFIERLKVFMGMKSFVPRHTEKSDVINLLIGATAVQLTFGLDDFSILSFDKIIIYPDQYYSTIREQHHKGEINVPLKIIVLSAKHFLEGLHNPDDGIHLGLHEFSHALNVHFFKVKKEEGIENFMRFEDLASQEMVNISEQKNHFLRKYGSTNLQEMFAVSTEAFFEQAETFSLELPELYGALAVLYGQDPKREGDPRI